MRALAGIVSSFQEYDPKGSGLISQEDCKKVLDSYACFFEPKILDEVARHCVNDRGKVDYTGVLRIHLSSNTGSTDVRQSDGVREEASISANAFATGSNQNAGNVVTGKPTTRVMQRPGGESSVVLGWDGNKGAADPLETQNTSSNRFACGSNQNAGNMITDRPTSRVNQQPGGGSSLDLSWSNESKGNPVEQNAAYQSSNRFACGSNQNAGNMVTDRPTSRVNQLPGGGSSLDLSWSNEGKGNPVGQNAAHQSSNRFACGSNQNAGNMITDRPTSRVNQQPGGGSSLDLSWSNEGKGNPVGQNVAHQSSNRFARGSNQNAGNMITDRPTSRVNQQPGGGSSLDLSWSNEGKGNPVRQNAAHQSSNRFACGSNQNAGNMITDRPTSRVNQQPGGGSSLDLSWSNEGKGNPVGQNVAHQSSNRFACGSNQNAGNMITDRPTSRVNQQPGGGSSLDLSWSNERKGNPVGQNVAHQSSNRFACGSNQNAGNMITDRPSSRVNQQPGGVSSLDLSWGSERNGIPRQPHVDDLSSNRFVTGSNPNEENVITDRSSSRATQQPGWQSSTHLSWGDPPQGASSRSRVLESARTGAYPPSGREGVDNPLPDTNVPYGFGATQSSPSQVSSRQINMHDFDSTLDFGWNDGHGAQREHQTRQDEHAQQRDFNGGCQSSAPCHPASMVPGDDQRTASTPISSQREQHSPPATPSREELQELLKDKSANIRELYTRWDKGIMTDSEFRRKLHAMNVPTNDEFERFLMNRNADPTFSKLMTQLSMVATYRKFVPQDAPKRPSHNVIYWEEDKLKQAASVPALIQQFMSRSITPMEFARGLDSFNIPLSLELEKRMQQHIAGDSPAFKDVLKCCMHPSAILSDRHFLGSTERVNDCSASEVCSTAKPWGTSDAGDDGRDRQNPLGMGTIDAPCRFRQHKQVKNTTSRTSGDIVQWRGDQDNVTAQRSHI